jgi:hypothetical protein
MKKKLRSEAAVRKHNAYDREVSVIAALRRLLKILTTDDPPGASEPPEALEQRKVFEAFLLAEYNNIANAHFNTVDSIANFMKNYIVIASVPFFVIGVLLSAKQSPEGALLAAVTRNPWVPGTLMVGLSVVGLCVLGYIINIRCDAILYARVVNGIRRYFYKRAALDFATEKTIRVLPTDVHVPRYFEPTYFGFVVAVFAIIGAAYFWVGLYYIEYALQWQEHWSIWLCTVLFLASHFLLYRYLAGKRNHSEGTV